MSNPYRPQKLTPEVIGQRLKGLLAQRGLRQHHLVEYTGIDPATICRVVNGRRAVSIHILNQLAYGLDCRLKDLVDPD